MVRRHHRCHRSLAWLTPDSPHLRHVSAPLAEAGISILYQSSYFTDFLLVKSSDFERASAIFRGQGCESDDDAHSRRS